MRSGGAVPGPRRPLSPLPPADVLALVRAHIEASIAATQTARAAVYPAQGADAWEQCALALEQAGRAASAAHAVLGEWLVADTHE